MVYTAVVTLAGQLAAWAGKQCGKATVGTDCGNLVDAHFLLSFLSISKFLQNAGTASMIGGNFEDTAFLAAEDNLLRTFWQPMCHPCGSPTRNPSYTPSHRCTTAHE